MTRKAPSTAFVLAAVASAVSLAAFAGTYYFDPVNGDDDNNDGKSEAKPFKHLSKKIDTAGNKYSNGDVFRLKAGVYTEDDDSVSYNITRSCTIQAWPESESRDNVIVDGQGRRRLFWNGGNDTRVVGITIRNAVNHETGNNNMYTGAGLNVTGSDCVVSNCVFANCTGSVKPGGALAIIKSGIVVDTVISNCVATHGGGIFASGSNSGRRLDIVNCIITNCTATGTDANYGGGGIYAQYDTHISGGEISGCTSSKGGGGVFFGRVNNGVAAMSSVEGTKIRGNTANSGGGVYLIGYTGSYPGATAVVSRVTFEGNVATGSGENSKGGALIAVDAQFISNCTFTANSATGNGGAVYIGNAISCGEIFGSTFSRNISAGRGGGAVYVSNRALVDSCVFDSNMLTDESPAAACAGGALSMGVEHTHVGTVRNSLFVGNVVSNGTGGAVGNYNTRSITNYVESCTFVRNGSAGMKNIGKADYYGGAIGGISFSAFATNCLFAQNFGPWTTYVQLSKDTKDCSHCFETAIDGKNANYVSTFADKGNIVGADPGFVDAASGDYSLSKGSVCVDAGVEMPWMASALDVRGLKKYKRIFGDAPDIGCYEYSLLRGFILQFR